MRCSSRRSSSVRSSCSNGRSVSCWTSRATSTRATTSICCRRWRSILDFHLLESLIKKVDVIYHLAAVVGVQKIIQMPVDTIEINVLGSHNTLTLAARHRKPCLLVSTSEVYGKSTKYPFSENDDAVYGPTTKSRWK